MADATKELVLKEFLDQVPPESGRVYEVSSTPDGKTIIKDVTVYQQDGTPWTAADAAQAINGLPPIGDLTFGFYRITYPGGDVNARTFPWVNFDDDLLPAKYPKLYALYGATLSVGAPSGYFNLKKLADRFPLVSSSNFGGVGGAAEHALTVNQMPRHAHAIAYKNAQTGNFDTAYVNPATGASIGSANGAIQAVGAGEPHNNMPPYIRAVAHIRAG